MVLEDVFKRYHGEGEQRWINQLSEEIHRVLQNGGEYLTSFLNPLRSRIAEEVVAVFPRVEHVLYGGYPGAQRVRLSIWPSSSLASFHYPPVSAIQVVGNFKKNNIHERDILGVLMDAGLSRDMIGDIIMDCPGQDIQVIILPEQVPRVLGIKSLAGFSVQVEEIKLDLVAPNRPVIREIDGTVASLRLDSIMTLGLGVSRSKASSMIKGGQVLVNYRKETSPSYKIKAGDVISTRSGKSNLEVYSLHGESRKGRQRITLKKIVT